MFFNALGSARASGSEEDDGEFIGVRVVDEKKENVRNLLEIQICEQISRIKPGQVDNYFDQAFHLVGVGRFELPTSCL